jgi:hypothetical protein
MTIRYTSFRSTNFARSLLLGIAASLFISSSARTGVVSDLYDREKTSIVKIHIEDEQTHKTEDITGVVMSSSGYILTKSTFLRDWAISNTSIRHSLNITAGSAGSYFMMDTHVSVVAYRSDYSLFMLSLRGSGAGEGHRPAQFCYSTTLSVGSKLYVMGFRDQNLLVSESYLDRDIGPEGLWNVAGWFDPGMTGAPVFDEKGFVIGLVAPGSNSIAGFQVFPLRWAKSLIEERTDSSPSCPTGEVARMSTEAKKSETAFTLEQFNQVYVESRALIIAASDYPGSPRSVWQPLRNYPPPCHEAQCLNPWGDGPQ